MSAPVFMARDSAPYLRQFLGELGGRVPTPADVSYVVKTVARELLSAINATDACPQVALFADWTVHNTIDRSKVGQRAIATIAESFPLHGTNGRDEKWLEERMNGAVSFAALRLELLAACRRWDLPEAFFTSWEQWQRFALPLAFEVSGRPIALGENREASKARERIEASVPEPAHRPATLMVVFDTQGKFSWRVETAGSAAVIIQVLFGGYRAADFPTPADWKSPLALTLGGAE